MNSFRAYRIHQEQGKASGRMETITLDDLTPGEVVIKVAYSSINFKDALAATGAGKILRRYPLVGGIDLAGAVVSSTAAAFQPGQKVLVTGCGMSETRDGGYAQYARLPSDAIIPLPPHLDEFQVMALGTAGYTAALAIHRMEQNGQLPEQGEVAVTGATGGVGSVAIDLLAGRGYRAVAISAKTDADRYLMDLGAARILRLAALDKSAKPLQEMRWAGAIDNLGGDTLDWLIRTTQPQGNVASIGMAASVELRTTVLPFILRGVNLLGINSSATPPALRREVWRRLSSDLAPRRLDKLVARTIDFAQLPEAFDAYLQGRVIGRTVVRIAG